MARGVSHGILAYVGKAADGTYHPFYFNQTLAAADVEIADDMYVITAERAEAYLAAQTPAEPDPPGVEPPPPPPALGDKDGPGDPDIAGGKTPPPPAGQPGRVPSADPTAVQDGAPTVLTWNGDIPAQKWVNFYMKVLTKITAGANLQLTLRVVASSDQGFSQQKTDEVRAALRELGLTDVVVVGP